MHDAPVARHHLALDVAAREVEEEVCRGAGHGLAPCRTEGERRPRWGDVERRPVDMLHVLHIFLG
eukprot:1524126-Pyramimonas_sp.AAC.1